MEAICVLARNWLKKKNSFRSKKENLLQLCRLPRRLRIVTTKHKNIPIAHLMAMLLPIETFHLPPLDKLNRKRRALARPETHSRQL